MQTENDTSKRRNSPQQKALEEIAKQRLADEMDDHSSEHADWEGGYEAIVKIARAALASENTPCAGTASESATSNPIESHE